MIINKKINIVVVCYDVGLSFSMKYMHYAYFADMNPKYRNLEKYSHVCVLKDP